jgi:hypothetical protein
MVVGVATVQLIVPVTTVFVEVVLQAKDPEVGRHLREGHRWGTPNDCPD